MHAYLMISCRKNILEAYFNDNYYDQSQCLYLFKIHCLIKFPFLDFPVVTIGPENPYRVEVDHTAEMRCYVDSKPR